MTTLFHFQPQPDIPIVCDFTGAADTPEERFAEYGRLFGQALVARERTPDGVVLTFTPGEGVAAWVADLAAREAACCPFMRYDVTDEGTIIRWVTSATSTEMAPVLDEYYRLYDEVTLPVDEVMARMGERGFETRGW